MFAPVHDGQCLLLAVAHLAPPRLPAAFVGGRGSLTSEMQDGLESMQMQDTRAERRAEMEQRQRRRVLSGALATLFLYCVWTVCAYFCFAYAREIHSLVGAKAERGLYKGWGIGIGLDQAVQWEVRKTRNCRLDLEEGRMRVSVHGDAGCCFGVVTMRPLSELAPASLRSPPRIARAARPSRGGGALLRRLHQ